MTDDIVHEATYPFPPEEVWRALTTPEAIGSWLMQTTFTTPTVGHRFEFRDKPRLGWSGITHCEVAECVPNRRLVYTFAAAEDKATPTRVEWDLSRVAEGMRRGHIPTREETREAKRRAMREEGAQAPRA